MEELEKLSASELVRLLPPGRQENGISPLFLYKDRRVKALVHEIKQNANEVLAGKVAELMAEKVLEFFEDSLVFGEHKIALVPVPTSGKRQGSRGYNPAEMLAQKMAAVRPDIFEYAPILVKIRETERQAKLRRKERLTNLVGAFRAEPFGTPKGSASPALIIDDVSTTGATITEAKRALTDKNINVHGTSVIAR